MSSGWILGIQYFSEAEQYKYNRLSHFWNTTNNSGFLFSSLMSQSNNTHKLSTCNETATTFFFFLNVLLRRHILSFCFGGQATSLLNMTSCSHWSIVLALTWIYHGFWTCLRTGRKMVKEQRSCFTTEQRTEEFSIASVDEGSDNNI